MRTFVALPVEGDLARRFCDAAREHLQRSRADVKWVASGHYHVTLRFLGEIGEDELEEVAAAVREAAASVPAFEVRLTEVGAFPSVRRPQTLWLGAEDASGCMAALERALSAALERCGFEPERKPFHPHVTLGRVRQGARGLGALTQQLEMGAPNLQGTHNGFRAGHITLFKSDLTPKGPVYTALLEAPLAGGK